MFLAVSGQHETREHAMKDLYFHAAQNQ
jgi:hypothetical protein